MIHFSTLKQWILRSYEKQQRRVLDDFGGDEEEVRKRVARMRGWADFCDSEAREVFRASRFTELFGRDTTPAMEPMAEHAKCERCLGAGLYWSDGCSPKLARGRSSPGFVACHCEAGRIRNAAIRRHGTRNEAARRGPKRDDF